MQLNKKSPFAVDYAQLATLHAIDATELVRELLWCEVKRLQISPHRVEISLRTTVADGGKLTLKKGQRYLWRNEPVEVIDVVGDRGFVRIGDDVRGIKTEEFQEIPQAHDYKDHALLQFTAEEWETASKAAQVLSVLIDSQQRTKDVEAAALDLGISTRHVWRLLKIYESNPSVTALLMLKPGRKMGSKLLSPEVEKIVADCIEQHYLKPERPTIASLREVVEQKCFEAGIVSVPTPATLTKRVAAISLEHLLKKREGKKAAREVCELMDGHLNVQNILDRIEIDHTPIDTILRADSGGSETFTVFRSRRFITC